MESQRVSLYPFDGYSTGADSAIGLGHGSSAASVDIPRDARSLVGSDEVYNEIFKDVPYLTYQAILHFCLKDLENR